MSKMVDARGLACPQPVILTRNAMQEAEQVVTLVDSETSMTNVSRMARKAGWQVSVVPDGEEFRIQMAQQEPMPKAEAPTVGKAEAAAGPLVLVVSSDIMGRGERELGSILMRGFFHTLGEVQPLPHTIILFNTGVRLACKGSPVLDDLCALEAEEIEILVCGTCLNYLALTEEIAAGQVSNMYDIAETMLGAGKVVNL
ncbi:MAG: sulfurtransferase-like selenium metabolism protein YedF [Anaerolineae bacterium]